MKKILLTIYILMVTLTVHAEMYEIGDVINHVLHTDIKTFINGQEIPSMNINGLTAVVVEDLRNYGFEVKWNPANRTLTLSDRITNEVNPIIMDADEELEVGTVIKDVLFTEIKTIINDKEISSFNIDGYTAIYVDELKNFGEVIWSEETRTINFHSKKTVTSTRRPSFEINYSDSTFIETQFKDEKIFYEGELIGFIKTLDKRGRLHVSVTTLMKEFGFEVNKIDEYNYRFTKGDYTCQVDAANQKAVEYYNGIKSKEFETPLLVQNDDIYMPDTNLLIGIRVHNDYKNNRVSFSYQEYEVIDYHYIEVQGELIMLNIDNLQSEIVRDDNYQVEFYNHRNYDYIHSMGLRDEHTYLLPIKENDSFNLIIHSNRFPEGYDRTIYATALKNIKPDYSAHTLASEWQIGHFTKFSLNLPANGYTETKSNEVLIEGNVEMIYEDYFAIHGNKFTVHVKKLDEGSFKEVEKQFVDFNKERYYGKITLNNGYGLYRLVMTVDVDDDGINGLDKEALRIFVNYVK
ncbi:hypothetical protein EZV73_03900 [Acidaminobacter sp. JC074]|uniref:hypothetical protein n=1 Tax=Acidaminobacter sp. JC074 TaxID=2530199 RepID=UPI001F0D6E18|nr:hypothetical protein [Acidaminobacter sp. JC074]MCH4886694.1 hypothetical protein [Acidaminobacter sp. JC074]